MKKNLFRVLSLVFAILCLVALAFVLYLSIDFPTTIKYSTAWGTYTKTYGGYFDLDYLGSIVLLSFGLFWGLVLYFVTDCNKESTSKDSKKEPLDGEKVDGCGCSSCESNTSSNEETKNE